MSDNDHQTIHHTHTHNHTHMMSASINTNMNTTNGVLNTNPNANNDNNDNLLSLPMTGNNGNGNGNGNNGIPLSPSVGQLTKSYVNDVVVEQSTIIIQSSLSGEGGTTNSKSSSISVSSSGMAIAMVVPVPVLPSPSSLSLSLSLAKVSSTSVAIPMVSTLVAEHNNHGTNNGGNGNGTPLSSSLPSSSSEPSSLTSNDNVLRASTSPTQTFGNLTHNNNNNHSNNNDMRPSSSSSSSASNVLTSSNSNGMNGFIDDDENDDFNASFAHGAEDIVVAVAAKRAHQRLSSDLRDRSLSPPLSLKGQSDADDDDDIDDADWGVPDEPSNDEPLSLPNRYPNHSNNNGNGNGSDMVDNIDNIDDIDCDSSTIPPVAALRGTRDLLSLAPVDGVNDEVNGGISSSLMMRNAPFIARLSTPQETANEPDIADNDHIAGNGLNEDPLADDGLPLPPMVRATSGDDDDDDDDDNDIINDSDSDDDHDDRDAWTGDDNDPVSPIPSLAPSAPFTNINASNGMPKSILKPSAIRLSTTGITTNPIGNTIAALSPSSSSLSSSTSAIPSPIAAMHMTSSAINDPLLSNVNGTNGMIGKYASLSLSSSSSPASSLPPSPPLLPSITIMTSSSLLNGSTNVTPSSSHHISSSAAAAPPSSSSPISHLPSPMSLPSPLSSSSLSSSPLSTMSTTNMSIAVAVASSASSLSMSSSPPSVRWADEVSIGTSPTSSDGTIIDISSSPLSSTSSSSLPSSTLTTPIFTSNPITSSSSMTFSATPSSSATGNGNGNGSAPMGSVVTLTPFGTWPPAPTHPSHTTQSLKAPLSRTLLRSHSHSHGLGSSSLTSSLSSSSNNDSGNGNGDHHHGALTSSHANHRTRASFTDAKQHMRSASVDKDAKRLFGLNTGYYQRLKLPLLRAEVHTFFLKLHQRYIISLKRSQDDPVGAYERLLAGLQRNYAKARDIAVRSDFAANSARVEGYIRTIKATIASGGRAGDCECVRARLSQLATFSSLMETLHRGFHAAALPGVRLNALPTTVCNAEGLRQLSLIIRAIDYIYDAEGLDKMMASKASLVFQRLANTLLERHHQHEPKWTDRASATGATSPDPTHDDNTNNHGHGTHMNNNNDESSNASSALSAAASLSSLTSENMARLAPTTAAVIASAAASSSTSVTAAPASSSAAVTR